MIIGCTGNYRKPEYFTILDKIHKLLEKENVTILVSDDLLKNNDQIIPKHYTLSHFDMMIDHVEMLFAIGGDGTILSTVRRLGKNQKPIMGIHIGGLGFLSECVESNLQNNIKQILKGEHIISNRMILEIKIQSDEKETVHWALNDFVIDHGPSARVIKLKVYVSDDYLTTYEGDGLIISTPTGSTAYSLSAGGPIIFPSMQTIAITPICPHSLSARSIVLESSKTIQINVPKEYDEMGFAVDGQVRFSLNAQTKINVNCAKHSAKLVRLPGDMYFKTLRSKMGWFGNVR